MSADTVLDNADNQASARLPTVLTCADDVPSVVNQPTFPNFDRFPKEIRIRVWRESMDPAQIAFEANKVKLPWCLTVLPHVCREARREVFLTHRLVWIRQREKKRICPSDCVKMEKIRERQRAMADYVNDLLVVDEGFLPHLAMTGKYAAMADAMESYDTGIYPIPQDLKEVPIHRLMCRREDMIFSWHNDWYIDNGPLPKGTKFLSQRRFPHLQEYYATYRICGMDWWLDGYQVQGPDIAGTLPSDNLWPKSSEDALLTHGAAYYKQKNITSDTGLRWPGRLINEREERQDSMYWDRAIRNGGATFEDLSLEVMEQYEHINTRYNPNIGLRGYSVGATSLGGH